MSQLYINRWNDKISTFLGLITYGTQPPLAFSSFKTTLQNRLCTVADSMRVADDLGKHKMAFKLLNKPVFGMKGSYVVTKVSSWVWLIFFKIKLAYNNSHSTIFSKLN